MINHNRSSKDQIILKYLNLLDLQHSKNVANVLSKVPYYTTVSKEDGEISDMGTLEN